MDNCDHSIHLMVKLLFGGGMLCSSFFGPLPLFFEYFGYFYTVNLFI